MAILGATLSRDDLLKRLSNADIAFAEVNTMTDLAVHPHLRRIEVDTPKGVVAYPAPAAIFVDQPRHYGAVPGIGEQVREQVGEQADTTEASRVRKSS